MGEGEGGNGMGKAMQLHFNFKINMNNFYSNGIAIGIPYSLQHFWGHLVC